MAGVANVTMIMHFRREVSFCFLLLLLLEVVFSSLHIGRLEFTTAAGNSKLVIRTMAAAASAPRAPDSDLEPTHTQKRHYGIQVRRRMAIQDQSFGKFATGVNFDVDDVNADVEALLEFRYGVTTDPHGVFANWTHAAASEVCSSWTGVSCENNTGRVAAVDLHNEELSGMISPSLGRLPFLSRLDLSSNAFAGSIPDAWGALQDLLVLNLSSNRISGGIPPSVSNCSSLKTLDLSGNFLTKNIPEEFGLLNGLEALLLDSNSLSGAIPNSLSNWTALKLLNLTDNLLTGEIASLTWNRLGSLQQISLGENNISGNIPISFGGLKNLEYLQLHNNNISGEIPSSLGNCSALRQLDLRNNFLTGELPSQVGSLQRLQYLHLEYNSLFGRIPSSLGLLAELIELVLGYNEITGAIPGVLSNCSSLEFLELPANALSGSIPREIFSLPRLRYLYLYYNELNGSIDPSIGNCTTLENFSVDTNHITGTLPDELGRLQELSRLNFFQNGLTGLLPPQLGNCSSMYDFSVRGNHMTGPIPASFGNLTGLQALRLGENNLTGSIPPELSKCKTMTILGLFSNRLDGNIPMELGELELLQTLNLSNNRLTGFIPSSLANCVSLTFLNLASNELTGPIPRVLLTSLSQLQIQFNLSKNHLSGSIPAEIGDLTSVQIIDLSSNNLSGAIPMSLGSCKGLLSLNLSSNNLQGEIPAFLASLPVLSSLNLSFNRLSGTVPETGAFAGFTSASFAGNPNLCGDIVDRSCSSHQKNKFDLGKTPWIILEVILGCVLFVLVILTAACFRYRRVINPRAESSVQVDELTGEMSLSVGDIMNATGGFSDANIVGIGAHSTIYWGILPGGLKVAVKKMQKTGNGNDDTEELRREVQSLGMLRHRNLLRIYFFCSTNRMDALVLEYMPRGSLWKELHEGKNCALTLVERLDIAMGVAEALVYLHYECPRPIIHMDLKPSNILLDASLVPKVADFGISRFARDHHFGEASVSGTVLGTLGYIPPEYAADTRVSTKGDVYSFGVVLLEMMTRKQPTDEMFSYGMSLRQWVMNALPHRLEEIVDRSLLAGNSLLGQESRLLTILQVGLLCSAEEPSKRPSMKDARKFLADIKPEDTVDLKADQLS